MSRIRKVFTHDRDTEDLIEEGLKTGKDNHTRSSAPQKMTLLKALRIATIDNFQVALSNSILSDWLNLSKAKRLRSSSFHWFVATRAMSVAF